MTRPTWKVLQDRWRAGNYALATKYETQLCNSQVLTVAMSAGGFERYQDTPTAALVPYANFRLASYSRYPAWVGAPAEGYCVQGKLGEDGEWVTIEGPWFWSNGPFEALRRRKAMVS